MIITDNTIWVLNFYPSINYLGRGFNVFCINNKCRGFNIFSMHELSEKWIYCFLHA